MTMFVLLLALFTLALGLLRDMRWWMIHRTHCHYGWRRRIVHPWLGQWPHLHCYRPVRFDYGFPDLRQDDFSVRTNQVVMAIVNMLTDVFHVEKGLIDERFHALILF